jgi:hypothetical protein
MADGVLYKANGAVWSKSQAKKANGAVWSNGVVKHANGLDWFDNYPMEQLYTQEFDVVWTQAYNGSGVKLDPATWGDHPRCGDSANFQGLFGFDRTAIANFISGGVIQSVKFSCKFDDPSHSGSPTVNFCPHIYTSKPTTWSSSQLNKNYKATSQFLQTGADYVRTITLPVGALANVNMAGVAIYATSASADSARFAGKTTSHNLSWFNSSLEVTVLK